MLIAKNIAYRYNANHFELKNIQLEIKAGQRVGLIGPSGAGKTTLLLILAGLLEPTYGEIFIDNTLVCPKNEKIFRQKINLLFQDPNDQLFNNSVYDEVGFGLKNLLSLEEDAIDSRIKSALKKVGMLHYIHRHPFHLSFGEKKKIALALILALDPLIYLLDEPTLGLDPGSRNEFISLIQSSIPASRIILIASHDIEAIGKLCDSVILMNKGQIVKIDEAKAITEDIELLRQNHLI